MKVSIVTISFNQGAFLEQAIQSVIEQQGVDLEYIIVDPGSKDNSREIIARYQSRISKVIFEKDSGPADGLNKGFRQATGDIFGYLNADDILLPGTLREVTEAFRRHQSIDVISGHGYVIDENGKRYQRIFSNKLSSSAFVKRRFTSGYSILVQQSTFFRKEIFYRTNGFDPDYKMMWDGALAVDFMNLGAKFKVVNRYWSEFRIYSNSITGSIDRNLDKTLRTYQMMQARAGLQPIPAWRYPVLRILGWIREPVMLVRRLIDQFSAPNRVEWIVPKPLK